MLHPISHLYLYIYQNQGKHLSKIKKQVVYIRDYGRLCLFGREGPVFRQVLDQFYLFFYLFFRFRFYVFFVAVSFTLQIISCLFIYSFILFLNVFIYLSLYFLYLRFLLFVFSYIFPLQFLTFPFRVYPSIRACVCIAVDTVAVYQVGMSRADRYCHQRSGHIGSTAMGNQLNIPFRADPHERYMACLHCTDPIIRFYMCA